MINKIKRQSGFTLVEMAIVLIIVGLFLGGAAKYEKIKNAENYGENIGTQMQVRLGALVSYGANNFDDIVAGNAIPGVAVNTAPTIPELQALGFLDPSYNDTGILPAGYTGTVTVVGTDLAYAVTTAAPVTFNGQVEDVVLDNAASVMGDNGGYSNSLAPATIAYPSGANAVNPLGAVSGVIQVRAGFGASGFNQFVRMGDTRAVTLQNTLEALTIELSNIVVAGAACADISVIARDAAGHVMSCVGGAWTQAGNAFWGDPVATFAALPVCNAASINVTRVVETPTTGTGRRAYTCNGAGAWNALAVDDTGNLTVANNLTVSNNATITNNLTVNGNTTLGNAAADTVTIPGNASIDQLSGDLEITTVAVEGTACAPNGRLARDANGLILSCQSGVWGYQDWNYKSIVDTINLNANVWPESIQCASGSETYRYWLLSYNSAGVEFVRYHDGQAAHSVVSFNKTTATISSGWAGSSCVVGTTLAALRAARDTSFAY